MAILNGMKYRKVQSVHLLFSADKTHMLILHAELDFAPDRCVSTGTVSFRSSLCPVGHDADNHRQGQLTKCEQSLWQH